MKPFQDENPLIFIATATFWRRIGAMFLILAIASFLFAYFGTVYFGGGDLNSIIVYAVVSVILGIVFSLCGGMLVVSPDKKLEINRTTGKIILTKKLFRTTTEEFLTSDVEKVQLIEHGLENSTLYLPQIVLRDGRIIEIPSENLGDEKKQAKVFERVKNTLLK